ncbi:TetR/AcrR family transcriptional regulator [Peribacillus frigoritolerans]|uniref:TetR/AcrR family transcriptional regulator n=1 Tax=Peribacillus frigoritolerans TaxID=450367 RepID=UPI000BACB256|nr:TetR/AcrR family transcriptional regulator [Peribacillus frigoritolerans]MCZ0871419.1 TetR/AcrR family transcriptional regulator [Peribacillus sp. AS_2]MDP9740490.1 AcrR family transcriptional regulator [Bacillus sp. B2I3]PAW28154.1 TetR family transcriptional regulator [Peribacillus simplex]PEF36813.1 TetR family transcriptional regulator [Bacillus sp. AFS094228]PEO45920.1 TetR family transcriptional regulator [Bacillus sp. AFS026049]PRS27907.1 TetR/AcrR family transcriptional regulator [
MKSNEIKEAALKYFTIHGYEGASLSQIAEEVGMKKQSIYAHFKGKDDLFLQVLRDAKETELSSKLQYFRKVDSKNPEKDLYGFLQLVIDLFQKNEHIKFWLRMSFFPPAHLEKEIGQEVIDIEEKVQAILECKFHDWINAKLIVEDEAITPTYAFLGVVDSILLELVYGNDEKRLNDKLSASWKVFWRGISQK